MQKDTQSFKSIHLVRSQSSCILLANNDNKLITVFDLVYEALSSENIENARQILTKQFNTEDFNTDDITFLKNIANNMCEESYRERNEIDKGLAFRIFSECRYLLNNLDDDVFLEHIFYWGRQLIDKTF